MLIRKQFEKLTMVAEGKGEVLGPGMAKLKSKTANTNRIFTTPLTGKLCLVLRFKKHFVFIFDFLSQTSFVFYVPLYGTSCIFSKWPPLFKRPWLPLVDNHSPWLSCLLKGISFPYCYIIQLRWLWKKIHKTQCIFTLYELFKKTAFKI